MQKYNIDAENSVISSCILDNNIISEILTIVKASDFSNQNIHNFKIIEKFYDKGINLDILIFKFELKTLEKEFDYRLFDSNTTIENVKYYANSVKELSLRRKLENRLDKLKNSIFIEQDLNNINFDFDNILKENQDNLGLEKIDIISHKVLEDYELRKCGEIITVNTYFQELDNILSGYENGSLNIIGARPSIGKTAFALNVALNNLRIGKNVVVYSLEMTNIELVNRLLSNYCDIPVYKIRKNSLSDYEYIELIKKTEKFAEYSFYINDTAEINYKRMKNELKILSKKQKIDIVIIDYLQLMGENSKLDNKNLKVSENTRALKILAKEFNIPVLLLSQLKRLDTKTNQRPQLSDLRDSGSIEQDADTVLFLHKVSQENDLVDFIVSKNRNGGIGECQLDFNKIIQRFEEF